MKYYLKSSSSVKEIDGSYFSSLKNAYEVCISGLLFEESIDLVLSNFIDFEKYLLNKSFDSIHTRLDGKAISEIRIDINKYASNILAIAYNYMQYGNLRIKTITSDNAFDKEKKKIKNDEFRFMEQLRNYTQHYGFPTHSISIDNFWTKKPQEGGMRNCTVKPFITISSITNDHNFMNYGSHSQKAKRKSDIDRFKNYINSDKANLTLLIRNYIDMIWELHKSIRVIVDEKLRDNIKIFTEAIEKMTPNNKTKLGCDIEIYKDGTSISKIPLAQRVVNEYNLLKKKHQSGKFSNILVSNQYANKEW
ncbi:hypothetical protein [Legionella sp. W05-934-2]|uniref:hypothetical protein n=1 Tax=Legionella sp. W05-934-2 TaxID=1198649 RepID=UPI00346194F8